MPAFRKSVMAMWLPKGSPQFSAALGATPGPLEITPRSGGGCWRGESQRRQNRWRLLSPGRSSVYGPVPLMNGKLSYFLSGYMNISDTYLPHTDELYSSIAGGSRRAAGPASCFIPTRSPTILTPTATPSMLPTPATIAF